MQLNEVTFAGFLGKDAEVFVTQSGVKIVTLSVCHTYKADSKETTTWMKVKVFGGWADSADKYRKGDNVLVRGRLTESKFEDKEGNKRTSIEIAASSVGAFVGKPPQNSADRYIDQQNVGTTRTTLYSSPKSQTTSAEDLPF